MECLNKMIRRTIQRVMDDKLEEVVMSNVGHKTYNTIWNDTVSYLSPPNNIIRNLTPTAKKKI